MAPAASLGVTYRGDETPEFIAQRFTPAEQQSILLRWDGGVRINTLAREHKATARTISALLRQNGRVPRRGAQQRIMVTEDDIAYTEAQEDEIVRLYRTVGKGASAIATDMKITYRGIKIDSERVYMVLRKRGVTLRKRAARVVDEDGDLRDDNGVTKHGWKFVQFCEALGNGMELEKAKIIANLAHIPDGIVFTATIRWFRGLPVTLPGDENYEEDED